MRRGRYVAAIALFAILAAYTYALRYRSVEKPPACDLSRLPAVVAGYAVTNEARDGEARKELGADATLFRKYRSGAGREAWLFVGYFRGPHEGSQIHSPKQCYPGAGWNILEEGSTPVALEGGETRVKHLVISNGVETHFVLYWFTGADGIILNEFALKWYQMKNSLLGRSCATAFVRFSTAVGSEDGPDAAHELVRVAEAIGPYLDGILRVSGAAPRSPEAGSSRNTGSE